MKNEAMIILDVWGGPGSQNLEARYVVAVDEALSLAKHELQDGYLVNLRSDMAWGGYSNFDNRIVREKLNG